MKTVDRFFFKISLDDEDLPGATSFGRMLPSVLYICQPRAVQSQEPNNGGAIGP